MAVADLWIAVPFTVSPLAGTHDGIPGLFHDPTGIALNHGYKAISEYITCDYDQLRSKLRTLLPDSSGRNGDRETVWSDAREFIGEYPGTNSIDRFREFLVELGERGVIPAQRRS
jgi:hypothetical protein